MHSEGPTSPARYPVSAFIEPATVVSHDDDTREHEQELVTTLQDAMADACAQKGLFQLCGVAPTEESAWSITTEITIDDYASENVAMMVIGGMLLPPMIGMAWSFPVFMGACEGHITWTLRAEGGRELARRRSAFDATHCTHALASAGFSRFLDDAYSALELEVGSPERYLATRALAAKSAVAVAGPRSVIAVFDLQDASGQLQPAVLDQLTEYLGAQLVELGGLRVVPRSEVKARLSAEKAESYGACYDEACQIQLGKALAAEKSLATKLLRIGSTCALSATLYDLKSETTELASTVEGECTEDALMKTVKALAGKFSKGK
jgi:hypothetical protein